MTPEELRHEIAKEAKEALEQKSAMRALISSPGWTILTAVLDAQIQNRIRDVMSGPANDEREWEKGEASGLKLARALPEILLEVATSIVPEKNDDSEDADDREPGFNWDHDPTDPGDDPGYTGAGGGSDHADH